jgi:3-deoxy-D-arabino-heptulosonate 7-phosphate (DAHP) synthase
MIEVHNEPEEALSDGFQSMYLNTMGDMVKVLRAQAEHSGRTLHLKKEPQIV